MSFSGPDPLREEASDVMENVGGNLEEMGVAQRWWWRRQSGFVNGIDKAKERE
jgi:hypothetical protein